MKHLAISCLGLVILPMTLSACATSYDPADVCTADWIAPRADRAVSEIESETQRLLKTLKSSGANFSNANSFNPIQMVQLSLAFNRFINRLENGRGMKDLKILARTCDDPVIIEDALTDFMTDKGLSPNLINFFKQTDMFQSLLEYNSIEGDRNASRS